MKEKRNGRVLVAPITHRMGKAVRANAMSCVAQGVLSAFAAGEKRQPFEEMHVLLVL